VRIKEVGEQVRDAAEGIKTAAATANGFMWAILAVAAAALLLGGVALVKASRSA